MQGLLVPGLTLSENLKALGPIFDAENAPSFEDTEAIKKRLSEEKLPTKLLQEYYLRFFSSLRIAEQVAKIAGLLSPLCISIILLGSSGLTLVLGVSDIGGSVGGTISLFTSVPAIERRY
eukprot:629930-Rhodomonas_salina.1